VFWRLGVYFSTFACGYLTVIDGVATACLLLLITKTSRSKPCKKTEVRKINSLKTSPEVGKITSLNTSPKETNLVKKYCEVG
jgi:hypothetical protein